MSTMHSGEGGGGRVTSVKRRSHHRRRCGPPLHFQSATAAEERYLQQAIQNSKLDKGRPPDGKLQIPPGPVFYPTVEEFEGNPLDYVEKIRSIAEKHGICKIVPPVGWNPGPHFGVDLNSSKKFETKQQLLHRLQEGISFGDGVEYTPAEYLRVSSERTEAWKAAHYPDHDLLSRHSASLEQKQADGQGDRIVSASSIEAKLFSPGNLERDYWDIVEKSKEVIVEYGNDVDTEEFGSGFPLSERGRSINGTKILEKMDSPEPKFGEDDYYKETFWNLNNIPSAPDSVLRHVRVGITGINVPWMYYGSLFTTFCWHNEDNNMYSINYHHRGAPKVWYGIPGTKECADGLEKVFKSYLSMKMREVPDLLHHITTMFSPRLLQNADVPVSKLLQHEGEFVITFPRAFHGGFSLGPNIGEAVNFASADWIAYGSDANERYRSFARPAVFSHDRLTFTMANHLKDQKSFATCKLLLDELERVVDEEMKSRNKLLSEGIQDVSSIIRLPKNVLDQLDEASASYDDKRLCHACKHICFLSAVACKCSQSKVSCLRHSHFMCRCPQSNKYLMIWCSNDELNSTLNRVRNHFKKLIHLAPALVNDSLIKNVANERKKCDVPGVKEDLSLHKNYDLPTCTITPQSFHTLTHTAQRMKEQSASSHILQPCIRVVSEGTVSPDAVTKRKFDEADLSDADSG